jgi:hypothetical protein
MRPPNSPRSRTVGEWPFGHKVYLSRIATVLSLLALYLFHDISVQGTVIAIIAVVFVVWKSKQISRIAYGHNSLYRSADLDSAPVWLQWCIFIFFLLICLLVIWGVYDCLS